MPVSATVPVVAAVKSEATTPVTPSEKVTVKASLAALLGFDPAGVMESTTGGMESTSTPAVLATPLNAMFAGLPWASAIIPPFKIMAEPRTTPVGAP